MVDEEQGGLVTTGVRVDASELGYGSLIPPDEALAILAMMRELLVRDYAGAMVAIVDETADVVRDGRAARQAGYATSYANTAMVRGSPVAERVYMLCSDLLWGVEPTNLVQVTT